MSVYRSRARGRGRDGARGSYFLPLWLIGAGLNVYLGVKSAGYILSEEAPVFLLVFALPALVALISGWKLRH